MRIRIVKKYLPIACTLFFLLFLPAVFIESLRAKTIGMFSPLWKGVSFFKSPFVTQREKALIECRRLEGENLLLRKELSSFHAIIQQTGLNALVDKKTVMARVIFRDPASWYSSAWVDVGEETNHAFCKKIIQKNSPVIYGKAVVGVIDHVGKTQSRIRFLTDSGLNISVRATRGSMHNAFLVEHIDLLLRSLKGKTLHALEESAPLKESLENLKKRLTQESDTLFLAKGVIHGSGSPLWRKKKTLIGTGFNYDFPDEAGEARDLITGALLKDSHSRLSLIEEGDLLVTTGMDGVFPKDFFVGEVTKIYPLKEGAFSYEIEAAAAITNLDDLKTLFIIEPASESITP